MVAPLPSATFLSLVSYAQLSHERERANVTVLVKNLLVSESRLKLELALKAEEAAAATVENVALRRRVQELESSGSAMRGHVEALRTLLEAVTRVASEEGATSSRALQQGAGGPAAWEAAAKEAARSMAARASPSQTPPLLNDVIMVHGLGACGL